MMRRWTISADRTRRPPVQRHVAAKTPVFMRPNGRSRRRGAREPSGAVRTFTNICSPLQTVPAPAAFGALCTRSWSLVTLAPGVGEEPAVCPDPYHHPHRRSAALNLPRAPAGAGGRGPADLPHRRAGAAAAAAPRAGRRRRARRAPELGHAQRPRTTMSRPEGRLIKEKPAATYSPRPEGPSTIGAEGLNCSVRNGKRCFPLASTTGTCRDHPSRRPLKTALQPTKKRAS